MDNLTLKTYEEALHKTLDALLMGVSALALITGSATLKSSTSQPQASSPQVGATYKKRSQVYLETGEERTVVETYKLNAQGLWVLDNVKIEDAPSA